MGTSRVLLFLFAVLCSIANIKAQDRYIKVSAEDPELLRTFRISRPEYELIISPDALSSDTLRNNRSQLTVKLHCQLQNISKARMTSVQLEIRSQSEANYYYPYVAKHGVFEELSAGQAIELTLVHTRIYWYAFSPQVRNYIITAAKRNNNADIIAALTQKLKAAPYIINAFFYYWFQIRYTQEHGAKKEIRSRCTLQLRQDCLKKISLIDK